MIKSKNDLKRYLAVERARYKLSKKQIILGILYLSDKGTIWKYQKRLRKCEYYTNTNKKVMASLFHVLMNKVGLRYGIHIELNSVEEGMRICHLGPVLIRGHVGKNSTIHINTALVGGGSRDIPPYCGDDLYLGIGSTIVGPVNIGNNVAIGAGAVVTKDVTDNCTVGGVPAKIVSFNGPKDWSVKDREQEC